MNRIGIVGASSILGKELVDTIGESPLSGADLVLLDEEDAAGRVTSAGEEATFIQGIDKNSFEGLDFVFFAGDPAVTRKYWQDARRHGASIVDLSYALEGQRDVLVRAPWIPRSRSGGLKEPDLKTPAVVAAHPAAVMLALIAARLGAGTGTAVRNVTATVMEPASEHGRLAMDELHQQTVTLLSFQSLPREQYDAQVAFNVLASLGAEAKVNLGGAAERILRQYAKLGGGRLPPLAMQLVHVPVFHGYAASVLVELAGAGTAEQVERAIAGEHVEVLPEEYDPPSNLSAAGQGDILVRVRAAFDDGGEREGAEGTRFWLWIAVDNLKFAALNAVACARELDWLRPQGKVQ